MKIIDCRGLTCPLPVVTVKKALEKDHDTNTSIQVLIDNEISNENVSKFLKSRGFTFTTELKGEDYIITTVGQEVIINDLVNSEIDHTGQYVKVVVVSSNCFGNGDDRLGALLMKSYFFALTELDAPPSSIIFMNSGVKLTCSGSDILESIEILANKGSEILSCGTCLDFYQLKDQLKIGEVTNMYTIVERMSNTVHVIKI